MDDELKNELLGKCVVCFNKNSTKNPCVKVEAADVLVILNHCDALKKKGVYSTSSLLDRLSAAGTGKTWTLDDWTKLEKTWTFFIENLDEVDKPGRCIGPWPSIVTHGLISCLTAKKLVV